MSDLHGNVTAFGTFAREDFSPVCARYIQHTEAQVTWKLVTEVSELPSDLGSRMGSQGNTGPEERAEAAARDLADRGLAVTARAVRETASVRMTVAATVARAWRDAEAEDSKLTVPEAPADVTARFAAIWADAYRAAAATITPERDRLATEVAELHGEAEALTAEVVMAEEERDAARTAAGDAEARATRAQRGEQEEKTRTEIAHAAAKEANAERDRLSEQVNSLIARIPKLED